MPLPLLPLLGGLFGIGLIALLSQYSIYVALIASFFVFLLGVKLSRDIGGFDNLIAIILGLILGGIIFIFTYQHVISALVIGIISIILVFIINIILPPVAKIRII